MFEESVYDIDRQWREERYRDLLDRVFFLFEIRMGAIRFLSRGLISIVSLRTVQVPWILL